MFKSELPKHSIVSIGTYGCIQSKENKHYFKEGLRAMLEELEPEIVLVYGGMPDEVSKDFKDKTRFIQFPDWISKKKGVKQYGKWFKRKLSRHQGRFTALRR